MPLIFPLLYADFTFGLLDFTFLIHFRVERKRSIEPLALSKVHLTTVVHVARLKILTNPNCQWFLEGSEVETFLHLSYLR